jgi:NSS family neurotransmitter:Na+ symporter
VFFFLLFVAAITSSISMLEVAVSWASERFAITRRRAAVLCGLVSWVLGVPAVLSFNIWSDVHPLGVLPVFAGKTVFDLYDYFAANILLPVGGLCIAVFAGWVMAADVMRAELGGSGFTANLSRWLLRYLTPLALGIVFVTLVFG